MFKYVPLVSELPHFLCKKVAAMLCIFLYHALSYPSFIRWVLVSQPSCFHPSYMHGLLQTCSHACIWLFGNEQAISLIQHFKLVHYRYLIVMLLVTHAFSHLSTSGRVLLSTVRTLFPPDGVTGLISLMGGWIGVPEITRKGY